MRTSRKVVAVVLVVALVAAALVGALGLLAVRAARRWAPGTRWPCARARCRINKAA